MKISLILLSFLLLGNVFSFEDKKYTQEEYLNMWKDEAIQQMKKYKIPASITMAQAILESGNGNSELARNANNHFGIKCSDWTGKKYYKDDNVKNECFRSYKNAKESYEDHSIFLTTRAHYASLFSYNITDYKSWAVGLRQAGYATSETYPQKLINLIEKLKLNDLDKAEHENGKPNPTEMLTKQNEKKDKEKINSDFSASISNGRQTITHSNKVKYIVAKKGDTFYRIAKEYEMGLWQLYKYNDFGTKKDVLEEGDIVYIQPKKRKSKYKNYFTVDSGLNLRSISQLEGIKLNALMEKNPALSPDEILSVGTKVKLK
jgi:LysM repeat protein